MGAHEGPYAHGPGRFEIRSRISSADGPVTRVTVLDERYGWLLEQHFYNAQGQLLASSAAANHRYYPEVGVSLPHHVAVQLPPPNSSFQIDVQDYTINQLNSDAAQLFTMPTPNGYPLVDLGAPAAAPPGSAAPQLPGAWPYPPSYPAANPPAYTPPSAAGQYPASGPALPANTPPPGYPTADYRPRSLSRLHHDALTRAEMRSRTCSLSIECRVGGAHRNQRPLVGTAQPASGTVAEDIARPHARFPESGGKSIMLKTSHRTTGRSCFLTFPSFVLPPAIQSR